VSPRTRARAVLAQAAMEVRLIVRATESLVITLGIPVGLLMFFSLVEVLPTGPAQAVDFLVPGVLAISVAATGLVAIAIQTGFERKYAVLKRLGATPLTTSGFLIAKSLAAGAILLVQTLLIVGLAVGLLGWRPAAWAWLPAGIVLGAVVCVSLGLLLAGTLRAEATLAASNALFLVLLVVSGVAFEADALPNGLAALGQALPLGALGALLRSTVDAGPLDLGASVTLVVWGLLALLAARRWFRWEP
jgi:ABC-2 type transport system permease protein